MTNRFVAYVILALLLPKAVGAEIFVEHNVTDFVGISCCATFSFYKMTDICNIYNINNKINYVPTQIKIMLEN